ncbi:hypothetical protein DY000_02023992 [Brassica cretica]|uniref:Uncharacterized protein n=1 Tax=Brassica cretica TaxID=69181 RepID=A0ABQ7ECZ8_BRACR|nr:hypothetical protein DY000_02023992 [Brassica cretica]
MPSSSKSNKENQLLFSSDPASLERSIRKGIRSPSIDNNTCSSLDFRQPPSTQTPVSSTDTRSSPSTEDTLLPSTEIFHPTSIDTEPRDMVATWILVRDGKGDLHDKEGHLRNVAGSPEHRSRTPTESTASCSAVRILTHEEFAARHPHQPSPVYVKIDRHSDTAVDRQKDNTIDQQPPAPIDRCTPLTYRVQMPKIDVARLNALRPQPKPSDNPPEATSAHIDDAAYPMEVDRKSSGGIVRDLEVQIGNALVPVDFHVFDIMLNWNSSLLLGRDFLSTVGTVCNMQTNQLCLTLIDPHVHYNPIPVKRPHTSSRGIDDPGLIAACHCGADPKEESVDSSPEDWENDYYNPTMAAHTRHTMHTEENAPSIDRTVSPSMDTHLHQTSRKRASTDIAYYPSIDTGVNRVREEDYSIGSWADDHHHESYAVETAIHESEADELHEGFTYEELLKMQRRDEADQHQAETCWERTLFLAILSTKPTTNRSTTTLHHRSTSVRNHHPLDPDGYARAIDGYALHVSREDIVDILQMANGADNLFIQQRNIPAHQQRVTDESYNTAGGVDNCFKQKIQHHTRPSIDVDYPTSVDRRPEFGKHAYDRYGTWRFLWEEKDEYGVYRDD